MSLLSDNIIFLRKSRNLSQKDFGKLLDVSDAVVSNWEKDNNGIKSETLLIISKIFDVSIDDLLKKNLSEEIPNKEDADHDIVPLFNKETTLAINEQNVEYANKKSKQKRQEIDLLGDINKLELMVSRLKNDLADFIQQQQDVPDPL